MILEQSLNDLLDTERYNFFNESQLLYIIDAALSPSNRESKWRVTMEPAAELVNYFSFLEGKFVKKLFHGNRKEITNFKKDQ